MAQIANLALTDGETVPVAHQCLPVSIKPGEVMWREDAANVPVIGQVSAKLRYTSPVGSNGVFKEVWTIETPILEVTSGSNSSGYSAAPKVAHSPRADVVFYFHSRTTSQQRKNVREMVSTLRNNVQYTDAVDKLLYPF